MKFGTTLLSTVLCSMLAMNLPLVAMAAPAVHTAEYDLVRNINAMTAEQLSADQAKAGLAANLASYQAASVKDGQQDSRFVQALVDNQVYSAPQAAALFQDAMSSSSKVASTDSSDAVISTEMSRLAESHLTGGQFSACDAVGGTVLAAGLAAVLTAVVFTHDGTTCVSGSGSNGSFNSCTTNNTGHNSNPQVNRDLYIGGAIGMAAGVILLIAGGTSGC
jgi:hypothetical protein